MVTLTVYIIHLPRLVFDCFQYANMELEGLGNVVMCCDKMVGGILKALSFLVMSSPRIFTRQVDTACCWFTWD